MRHKTTLTLLFSVLLFLFFQVPSFATMSAAADTVIVIDPFPILNPGPGGPKTPVVVPIAAYYESMTSSVILSFIRDLGDIEVVLLNTNTAGYYSDYIDTQYLYAIIPISLGPGHYIITFTLPSGQQYQGEFNT